MKNIAGKHVALALMGMFLTVLTIAQDQKDVDQLFNEAALAYVKGDYDGSKKILLEGMEAYPDNSRLMSLNTKVGNQLNLLAANEESKGPEEGKETEEGKTEQDQPEKSNGTASKNNSNVENTTSSTTTTTEPKEKVTPVVNPDDPTQITISLLKSYGKFSDGSELDVSSGTKMVCIFSMTCSHCQQVYREMCEMKGWNTGKLPLTYMYNYGEPGEQEYFFEQAGGCTDPHIRFGQENYSDFMRVLEGEDFPRILVFKGGNIVKRWDVDSYSKEAVMEYFDIEEPKSDGLFDEEPKDNSPWGNPW